MTTAGFVTAKGPFRVIAGRRADVETEEAYRAHADAMFFRSQTLAIVRHFFEISCQIGRLPSILGREFFRARVSHHAIPSFEDQVLFVHDVERALSKLDERDAEVIALVGLFHYSLAEAAALLGRSRSTVCNRYADSIDHLAQLFLEAGLLQENRPDRRLRRFPNSQEMRLLPKKPPLSVGAAGARMAARC
jgi:Sigma-70, region 4